MAEASYIETRGRVQTYFDETAVEAWRRLTSNEPVSGIRATVRAGRDRMRATLAGWLPDDLAGARVLDAGCGTGAMSQLLAERGADVLAIDLSPRLVEIAKARLAQSAHQGRIDFRSGDLADPALGAFDYVVSMDVLIHYRAADAVTTLERLAARTHRSVVFTFAPRTPLLATMHTVGRVFPRSDRAPSIEPVARHTLTRSIAASQGLAGWREGRGERVTSGFYISEAMELSRC